MKNSTQRGVCKVSWWHDKDSRVLIRRSPKAACSKLQTNRSWTTRPFQVSTRAIYKHAPRGRPRAQLPHGQPARALKRTVLNSVLTAPGLMALTRTAVPTRSCRAQSVKPRMKCFVPQYTEPGRARTPPCTLACLSCRQCQSSFSLWHTEWGVHPQRRIGTTSKHKQAVHHISTCPLVHIHLENQSAPCPAEPNLSILKRQSADHHAMPLTGTAEHPTWMQDAHRLDMRSAQQC